MAEKRLADPYFFCLSCKRVSDDEPTNETSEPDEFSRDLRHCRNISKVTGTGPFMHIVGGFREAILTEFPVQ